MEEVRFDRNTGLCLYTLMMIIILSYCDSGYAGMSLTVRYFPLYTIITHGAYACVCNDVCAADNYSDD